MIGPVSAEGDPEQLRIQLRRYRCRGCDAVVVSAPRGLLPRMLYGAVAVALALGLWGVEGQAGWRVRSRVDPVARDRRLRALARLAIAPVMGDWAEPMVGLAPIGGSQHP